MHIHLYRIWLWSAGVAQSQLRCIRCYRCSIVYYMHISIGGASSRWMYPTLKPAGGRVGPNHPHLSFCTEPCGLEQCTLGLASVPWGMYGWCHTIHIFSLMGMTHQQSYSTSLHSPETLRATLYHQKFTLYHPSAPNTLPTTKNTRALSYASLAKTGSTLPAQHLLTPNNTQTPGPAPNVTLRPHLQSLHL